MASDTSDTEEFYDAPEDVNSPTVSPVKFILPAVKESAESITQNANLHLKNQELKQDDPIEIIDSIIEQSQKVTESYEILESENPEVCNDDSSTPMAAVEVQLNIIAEATVSQKAQNESPEDIVNQNISVPQLEKLQDSVSQACLTESKEPSQDDTHLVEHTSSHNKDKTGMKPNITVDDARTDNVKEGKADILEKLTQDTETNKEALPPAKPPRQLTMEPDIVASTKKAAPIRPPPPSSCPPPRPPPPARPAPPPRKKKSDPELESQRPSALEVPSDRIESSGLVSPNTAVEFITKELQHSLDLASATSGDKVVTAQENGKAADGQISESVGNESSGPQRPRSNSGRELTDEEILASVMIKNLDTGEEIPLSLAEEKLPTGINPLTLHIMRRTKEYVTNDAAQSDDEDKSQPQLTDMDGGKLKQKTTQLKKFLGKSVKRAKHLAEEYGERAVNKVKSVRDEVFHTDQDDPSSSDDEGMPYTRPVKFKAAHGFKGPFDFDQIKVVQDLSGEHTGAVWTMKFAHCGRLLATAGQDKVVRIWVLKNAFDYFNNMRMKYNTEGRVSPSPSQESLSSSKSDTETTVNNTAEDTDLDDKNAPFRQQPFCKYKGHTADLLDLSWSKNYFLLSSSMDKTVRLWHISRRECLCCFQHIDFVTAIAFHPRDDRYFLSGSLDGKLRLWNIPDKKVALWNEVDGQTRLITAANFCQNGKYAVIGTYDGRCIFYDTEHLKYHTQIHVRSTRGRNRVGRKITGIEPLPGENKILVTSNDSRIRLYDLRDLSLSMKYKGYVNSSSQIKASFSHDYSYIMSGSEDKYVYIWSTYHDLSKFTSVRRDRNDFWEGIKAHNAVVTSAIFAPNPSLIVFPESTVEKSELEVKKSEASGLDNIPSGALKTDHTEVLLSADFTGAIKVFINRKKN
ncbi:WD repeat-containing protein 44 [Erpetoichthys calabaricus]|uniref:WD repeat-containing protein 44 n=1 Tax=Erpetoichthys calabaricus TaxID=27687 RepID=UPI0022340639|nr:WD repeat-containing protein 44 [Erpetoichthys calabaricus]